MDKKIIKPNGFDYADSDLLEGSNSVAIGLNDITTLKEIKISTISKDYNPISAEYNDESSVIFGGGSIYESFCNILGLYNNSILRKVERLQERDKNHILEIIQNGFEQAKKETEFIMDNFYS